MTISVSKNLIGERRINPKVHRQSLPIHVPSLPSVFTLELTTLCDNRCTGCANIEVPQQRQIKQMQHGAIMVEWKKIIDSIIEQTKGKTIIRLSGGEPTLHPNFGEIVRYLDTKNVPHALLTTGKWQKIGTKNLINLYKSCKNAVGFLISLHGKDAVTHNSFVESGEKSFEKTLANIRLTAESGIDVFTSTVITNQNYLQVAEIVRLCQTLGVKYSVFNRFQALNHPLLPKEQELLLAIESIMLHRKNGIPCRIGNHIPPCFYPLSNFPSAAAYELCHISPVGNIRPDNLTPYSFGNLFSDSLTDIWQNAKSSLYRESVPSTCLQCTAFNSCRGGSKSLYFLTGSNTKDSLMKNALNIEQTQRIFDDKEKKQVQILALTSD